MKCIHPHQKACLHIEDARAARNLSAFTFTQGKRSTYGVTFGEYGVCVSDDQNAWAIGGIPFVRCYQMISVFLLLINPCIKAKIVKTRLQISDDLVDSRPGVGAGID